MPFYVQAPEVVTALVDKALSAWHQELRKHGVRVATLLAYAFRDEKTDEPKGPAIMHHGYPALGLMKVNSHRDRVEGKADATLILDGDQWNDLSEERQIALIDHELTHLLIVFDDEGNVKLDDCCRPKLKIRPHDLIVGGFKEVIERHKEAACEAKQIEDCKQFVQGLFPGWG